MELIFFVGSNYWFTINEGKKVLTWLNFLMDIFIYLPFRAEIRCFPFKLKKRNSTRKTVQVGPVVVVKKEKNWEKKTPRIYCLFFVAWLAFYIANVLNLCGYILALLLLLFCSIPKCCVFKVCTKSDILRIEDDIRISHKNPMIFAFRFVFLVLGACWFFFLSSSFKNLCCSFN